MGTPTERPPNRGGGRGSGGLIGLRLAIAGIGALLGIALLLRGAILIGGIVLTLAVLRLALFVRLWRLRNARVQRRQDAASRWSQR